MRPSRRTDSSGLGLVGLLAVVVLLALLAAGTYLALRGASTPAAVAPAGPSASPTAPGATGAAGTNAIDATRVAACQALAAEVQTALTLYQAQHGSYPGNLAALVPGLLKENPASALAPGQSLGYSAASGTLTPHCG